MTLEQQERRRTLKARLSTILKDKEGLWKTHAKQQWLQGGDDNTKFFYAIANNRRHANAIGMIIDEGKTFMKEDEKRH